ncbi:unnamed protein product [Prunus brigantina]
MKCFQVTKHTVSSRGFHSPNSKRRRFILVLSERKPGRSGHLLHKNCASVAAARHFPARGGAAAPPCSLIGPPVTALVCSNGNQGQLVFCKQHGAAVKERSFKSLPDWLKRVVFLPLITVLSQKHSISSFSSRTFLQGDPFLGIFGTLDLLSPLLVTFMVRFLYAKENLQGTQKHHSTMMCHAQFCFGEDGRVSM